MVSPRLERKVRRDFAGSSADAALARLAALRLALAENQDCERIQTAVVLLAAGDDLKLERAALSAETDWRDVLVWSGLANGDWRARLGELLD
ncbi:MAG: hypothetical protein QOI71_3367 [Gaiellales bacterium]|jgi:hypothetical protein|nr:hypothetical protein [Gaiellales bacterium]